MVSKVFVAGGAGRTGARVVRALATRGISVRVGCRDVEAAKAVVEGADGSFAQAALLTYVPVDVVERPEGLLTAIGDADAVVSALGATSTSDPTLPYKVDSVGTTAVWEAAVKAGTVEQAVMVSSLGTEQVKFPAALLNLFWGILLWSRCRCGDGWLRVAGEACFFCCCTSSQRSRVRRCAAVLPTTP